MHHYRIGFLNWFHAKIVLYGKKVTKITSNRIGIYFMLFQNFYFWMEKSVVHMKSTMIHDSV